MHWNQNEVKRKILDVLRFNGRVFEQQVLNFGGKMFSTVVWL